jgi:triosephosphate isomerase (TIM)
MKRKKVIAANWKMYKTPVQAESFVRIFLSHIAEHQRDDIVLCPSFVCLHAVVAACNGTHLRVGAQNMHWMKDGAYTGEVSAEMLLAAGCTHVIIGHSERRQYFGETDDTVNAKLKTAIAAGLKAIVCIGEVLEERESGATEDVLRRQTSRALREISSDDAAKFVIAYEPVWAIGTGRTATPDIAGDAHRIIRAEVANQIGKEQAERLRILYGGSVKPDNAKGLLNHEEIDGALVGGASLIPEYFAEIVKY